MIEKISKEQQKKAQELRDKLAQEFDEKEAKSFAQKNRDKSWYEDFLLLLEMIKDPDFNLSNKSKFLIMGTLAYVIFPVDIVPDFMPIVGWLDDVFILRYTIDSIQKDIEAYRRFRGK